MDDNLLKLAQQARKSTICDQPLVVMDADALAEFARLIRADERERCARAAEGELLTDAVNCGADRAYNAAIADAIKAIRAIEKEAGNA